MGKGNKKGRYLFRVVEYSTDDLEWMALARAVPTANPVHNIMFTDLPFAAVWDVMEKIWPRIDKVHRRGGRCLVLLDVSDFPLVRCYVDQRDQRDLHAEGNYEGGVLRFWKSVVSSWLSYDPAREVPAILNNVHLHAVLRRIFRKEEFGKLENRKQSPRRTYRCPTSSSTATFPISH